MTIGDRIRKYREREGLTQRQFAALVGVRANSVARWERGELGFHPAQLEKVEAQLRKGIER